MNAVISGTAGRALVIGGSSLKSFDVDDPSKLAICQQADEPYLFGEGRDLRVIQNADFDSIVKELKSEARLALALDLTLISLDGELEEDIRKDAIQELDELLGDAVLRRRLEGIMYARPLPDDGDLGGALKFCGKSRPPNSFKLFQDFDRQQSLISKVRAAWDAIPTKVFGGYEQQMEFERLAARQGLFRSLVRALERLDSVSTFLKRAGQDQSIAQMQNNSAILEKWVAPFQDSSYSRIIHSENDGVQEALTTMVVAGGVNANLEGGLSEGNRLKTIISAAVYRRDSEIVRELASNAVEYQRGRNEVENILTDYQEDVDAIYQRCAETYPGFGVSTEDFRKALTAAAEKYVLGYAERPPKPSVGDIRQVVAELHHLDLYLAIACMYGNERAWWEFDRQHRSFIERWTRHLVRSDADADEVIDAVYVELFGTRVVDGVRQSKFRTYTGRGSLRGWLRAIILHAAVDVHRAPKVEVSMDDWSESGDEFRLQHVSGGKNEDSIVTSVMRERYRSATVAALDQALSTLDDHERLLLVYYHVEGLKLREIARILEEPKSPLRRWFERRSSKRSRMHESAVMRWLEKTYRKFMDRFFSELKGRYGLNADEVELCITLVTEDPGTVNFDSGRLIGADRYSWRSGN